MPIPASSLARALPPVASISRPSAEPRTTAPVTINMPSTTTTGAGTPSTAPLPSQTRSGAVKVTMRPSVMSCAMPRPATIRIKVATIGWMPSTATRKPFHSPQSSPAPSAAASASGRPWASARLAAIGAGDRHHRADRQIDAPRGDHQHHAEREQRHRRAAVEDVDQAAEQPAVLHPQIEELRRDDAVDREDHQQGDDLGKAAALQQSLQQAWHHARPGFRTGGACGGDRRENVGDVDGLPCQLVDMGAVAQHDHPVRIGHDLVELGGNHQQRQAVVAQFADQADDLGMGADVDAAGRLVQHQEARRGGEPAGEQHLLLVAAGQQPDRPLRLRRADVEQLDEALAISSCSRARQRLVQGRAWPAAPARCFRAR